MGLDYANAGQLPNAPDHYSQQQQRQMLRVLEIYFSQLDSDMPRHAEQYKAKRFIGGIFYGDKFFGDGNFLSKDVQRFASFVTQAPVPLGTANVVAFESVAVVNSITCVPPGKLTVSFPSRYRIDYFLHFENSAATAATVNVWARLNGVDRANTNAKFTVPASGALMAAFSIIPTLVAGDYIEIAWAASVINVSLVADPAVATVPGVNPAIPASPSAVVNMALLQADIPLADVLPLPRRLRPP